MKLTGDGTNIGKHLHVVNFGFILLDEGEQAYSAAGKLHDIMMDRGGGCGTCVLLPLN